VVLEALWLSGYFSFLVKSGFRVVRRIGMDGEMEEDIEHSDSAPGTHHIRDVVWLCEYLIFPQCYRQHG